MLSPWKLFVLNAPFWVGLITLILAIAYGVRFRQFSDAPSRVRSGIRAFLCHSFVWIALAAGAVVMNAFALYMSYVAPWDVLQDVVSAQQLLQGKSAYPLDMKALMRSSLAAEPPAFH
jgi:hypothetical protein